MNIATKNKLIKNPALHQGKKEPNLTFFQWYKPGGLVTLGCFCSACTLHDSHLQIRSREGRQRRSFSPQPVSFNLKGKVKLFQKLLLLRFGLDPPGIRKFSFLLVMCLKMRLELFLFSCIGWEKQKKRGRDEKSFTDVMQAGIQNVTHERDLAKIIIPACTTSSNWVTTDAQCAHSFPFATPDGSRFITHECDNLWDCFVSEWHIYVKRGFR